MTKPKLLLISFLISFCTTAALCILNDYPLIFYPINYGFGGFLSLGILFLFLCFGLVYLNLPILKWIKEVFLLKLNSYLYFIISTLIILQLFTMAIGYLESLSTRGLNADPLFYYKCVTNSCLYLMTGNFTAIIAAYLFGKKEDKSKLVS